jgi:hypothetical protein
LVEIYGYLYCGAKTKVKRKTLTCMDDQSAEVRAVLLAEVVGFEPTVPFDTSVFKTAALSHAQPHFHL